MAAKTGWTISSFGQAFTPFFIDGAPAGGGPSPVSASAALLTYFLIKRLVTRNSKYYK